MRIGYIRLLRSLLLPSNTFRFASFAVQSSFHASRGYCIRCTHFPTATPSTARPPLQRSTLGPSIFNLFRVNAKVCADMRRTRNDTAGMNTNLAATANPAAPLTQHNNHNCSHMQACTHTHTHVHVRRGTRANLSSCSKQCGSCITGGFAGAA